MDKDIRNGLLTGALAIGALVVFIEMTAKPPVQGLQTPTWVQHYQTGQMTDQDWRDYTAWLAAVNAGRHN